MLKFHIITEISFRITSVKHIHFRIENLRLHRNKNALFAILIWLGSFTVRFLFYRAQSEESILNSPRLLLDECRLAEFTELKRLKNEQNITARERRVPSGKTTSLPKHYIYQRDVNASNNTMAIAHSIWEEEEYSACFQKKRRKMAN
ncbi:hypothetical protein RO3G_10384 [Rhizopus delemar RA 99-880]|uniref:Uncharacterized protein n=1 Tax=Rhizopus delemar (strain RA 99-880 / ATCC MYA-4621 / FGSC 9543 / NRRL 43880) TaxID=246409 RepID=I1CB44_RHIO9|nr:hypothetical protein RO3G_10384 [Rhizopus delemar RA 99-880]|eukprot:EIE85674.1 hypothetical protein RO3G_10384 [Rhizopus delemar RA 99-880]